MNKTNIIEQAAKRLEALRRSGTPVPHLAGAAGQRINKTALNDSAPVPSPARRSSEAPFSARGAQGMGMGMAASNSTRPSRNAEVFVPSQMQEVSIDLDRLSGMGYLVPGETNSLVAAEFRHIKRPLLRNAVATAGDGPNRNSLIMVTSAVAGEGKTYCAINLAMSIAMEVDTSVLLVDADAVRPAVLERLGLRASQGLLDVLTGDVADVGDVILKTDVPKLSVLPAGMPRPMSTELLASAAMDELLQDLATRYPDRVVVLDAPPLLLTTESPVLASRVGQVVIVVGASETNRHKVEQAFATVESCPLVMALLNKCPGTANADGYGYGYQ